MNYVLNKSAEPGQKNVGARALKGIFPLLAKEKGSLVIALVAVLVSTAATLATPVLVGYAVDHAIQTHDFAEVLKVAGLLLAIFVVGLVANYLQTIRMGTVGRHVLYELRNQIFVKLQELPLAFFNQNKVGDLISRINNDTDRLNQFFAQTFVQFASGSFVIIGTAVFLVTLNPRLGAAALAPAVGVLLVTVALSPWVKRTNVESLRSLGNLSAEIQESLSNFKVIVAFNRLDYFRDKFAEVNAENYAASMRAGIANNVLSPLYALAASAAQLVVLVYGLTLIASGNTTVGLLVGFLLYVNGFYTPFRQLASVWSIFQSSMAALDRISEILALSSDMPVLPATAEKRAKGDRAVLSFRDVSFRYPEGKDVLKHVNLSLEKGKTYALVGPTGGGKTTTASLMARLYDPTDGVVELDGRDIRTYAPEERSQAIGFILQEPFLFGGTVLDNLFYGHPDFADATKKARLAALKKSGLDAVLGSFEKGFDTPLQTSGETISLGQRQLIAFVRAVLRKPEVLILDEATANIDTVTEQLLQQVLAKLPATTTRVVVANRLNTIENADEIFFVNDGEVKAAGSFAHAVEMLTHGKRKS